MHVHMARARWWCPISSPKADLILLSGVQYHTLRSLPRPNIYEDGSRAAPDGIESAKVERESAHSQLRIPSGQRPKQRRGAAVPPRADHVFARAAINLNYFWIDFCSSN